MCDKQQRFREQIFQFCDHKIAAAFFALGNQIANAVL